MEKLNIRWPYSRDIVDMDVLPKKEERDLLVKAKQGNDLAINKLVLHNMRLVFAVYNDHFKAYEDLSEDLVQEGIISLYYSISAFDLDSNYRFSSYAYKAIYYKMLDYIKMNNSVLHCPGNKANLIFKIKKAIKEFNQLYGYLPSPSQIAEITKISKNEVEEIIRCFSVKSLEEIGEEDYSYEFESEILNKEFDMDYLKDCYERLTGVELDYITNVYGLHENKVSQSELSRKYRVSRQNVNQTVYRSLDKMRLVYREKIDKN